MCVAYALVGFGLSLQNAHYNAFVASSKDYASTKIGILLASYGQSISSCTCKINE